MTSGRSPSGQQGAKGAGENAPGTQLDEFDIADELKGKNALAGNDQANVSSQRHAQAGASGETDDLIESFRKTDREYRAAQQNARPEHAGEEAEPGGPDDEAGSDDDEVDRPGFDLGGSSRDTRAGRGLGLDRDAKSGREDWTLRRKNA